MKYQLSIISIFKNESHILEEWLQYYISVGVEHFYLVDNNSSDHYQSIISKYISYITLLVESRSACQLMVYNELLLPLVKQTSHWILVVDLDEFVYNPDGYQLIKKLNNYQNVGGVSSPWIFFGSSGHINQPDSVLNNFYQRMDYNNGVWINVKNFYQTKFVDYLYPHHADFNSNQIIVSSKSRTRIIDGKDWVCEDDLKYQRFDFLTNHYPIQSLKFFLSVKSTRGDVYRSDYNSLRNLEYFKQYDYNQRIDKNILNYNHSKQLESIKFWIIGYSIINADLLISQIAEHYQENQHVISYRPEIITCQNNQLVELIQQNPNIRFIILVDRPKRIVGGLSETIRLNQLIKLIESQTIELPYFVEVKLNNQQQLTYILP